MRAKYFLSALADHFSNNTSAHDDGSSDCSTLGWLEDLEAVADRQPGKGADLSIIFDSIDNAFLES